MGRSRWVWGRRFPAPRSTEANAGGPVEEGSPSDPRGSPQSPLPALGETLGRFLGALEPLLPPRERRRTRRLLRDFGAPGGVGERLQEKLRRGGETTGTGEWPWGTSERLPLPVHTSMGLVLPRQHWEDWRGQLWFAARLVAGVLDYREQLERRPPAQRWVLGAFGGCRVPGRHRDELLRGPPSKKTPPSITVIRHGQFFQLEARPRAGPQGAGPEWAEALWVGLRALREGAGAAQAPPMGLLTGQDRPGWGRGYQLLMRDRLNRLSIGRIQRSLFALSLDSPVLEGRAGWGPGGGAGQVLHGGGAGANSANRWFDKSLQFIVGEDGTCGVVFDPAMIDSSAVAHMVDHALEYSRRPEASPALMTSPLLSPPPRLHFSLSPELGPEIERAKRHLDSLAADVDLYCFTHPGVTGGSQPVDPQALLQVALQVAYYRLHGSLCASCQPTTLDPILPGVSDLLRPPGALCLALARALGDPTEEPEQQLKLLRAALEAQRRSFQEVLSGEGPERHLQRLRQAALGGGEPLPHFFLEPAVTRSTHFRLCSIQLHSREPYWLLRGPLVPDGYGVGVVHVTLSAPPPPQDPSPAPPGPPSKLVGGLRVAVASFSCCRETEAAALGGQLKGVLQELGELLQDYGTPPGGY